MPVHVTGIKCRSTNNNLDALRNIMSFNVNHKLPNTPMYCFSEIFSYFQRWFEIYLTSSLHFIVEAATPATGTTITWLDRGDNLLSLLRKQKVSVTYDFGIRSFMRPSLILKTWLEFFTVFFTSGSLLDHLSMHFNKRSLRWTCNYNLLQDKIIVTQDINVHSYR